MWYEILPAFFCYAGCMSMPFIICPTVNYILFGKPMIRECLTNADLDSMRRDNCLDPTGSRQANHTVYWEGIPDKTD